MPPRGKKGSAKASKAVQPVEEPVEAPSEPITIHVTGLQRPWQDAELKTKVTNAAGVEISEYRVNDARSEAFITVRSYICSSQCCFRGQIEAESSWKSGTTLCFITSAKKSH